MADAETKPCIWCAEEIKANARICRYCNREQVAAEDPDGEKVLYSGTGLLPLDVLLVDLLLCFVCVGLFTGLWHMMEHSARRYRITNKRIELSRGLVNRRVESLELYRVVDVRYRSSFGRGTIVVLSGDKTHPSLKLPIPNASQVFTKLRDAVGEARRKHGVGVREFM